jgi:hypothetical protein
MLNKNEMIKYFEIINEKLKQKALTGEICLFGGAVMCLVFESRAATKDIDAVFAPTTEMYQIIKNIAEEHQLPQDWLNLAVKGFVSSNHDIRLFQKMSHLDIYAASPQYMFAMKCLAARSDSKDFDDIRFLIKHLNIKTMDEAIKILGKYYPQKRILPRTQYVLEEFLES